MHIHMCIFTYVKIKGNMETECTTHLCWLSPYNYGYTWLYGHSLTPVLTEKCHSLGIASAQVISCVTWTPGMEDSQLDIGALCLACEFVCFITNH